MIAVRRPVKGSEMSEVQFENVNATRGDGVWREKIVLSIIWSRNLQYQVEYNRPHFSISVFSLVSAMRLPFHGPALILHILLGKQRTSSLLDGINISLRQQGFLLVLESCTLLDILLHI